MTPLTFTDALLARRPPTGIDVDTTLAHFAIVTYHVAPEALRRHVPARFALDLIQTDAGPRALVSVVPFVDQDFRLARFPWPTARFGQTNYRAYVTDTETGEHAVWFFGTTLDTPAVLIPRHLWQLPWHGAPIRFDVAYDAAAGRYQRYGMVTPNGWAEAQVALEDTGRAPEALPGFPDLETGLVIVTHPRRGYFYRRDGALGSYSIWHARLRPTVGRVISARFALLDRLGLVPAGDLTTVHSVLIQPRTEFTIYLPPTRIAGG